MARGIKKTRLSKRAQVDFDFAFFFQVWAEMHSWDVPAFHYDVIKFLESCEDWTNAIGVLQVFRGAAKSSIVGLFVVYMLVRNPALRFLILSCDHDTAKKMSEDCRSIIDRHPLAQHLKSEHATWEKHQFFVRGSTDARNPSVRASGILSNVTGARADFVIFDDVEVPKNTQSGNRRIELRKRMSESNHILIPKTGRTLYIGTPHTFDSIYPELVNKGVSSLLLPLVIDPQGEFPNITGRSRWPERFDEATIAHKQITANSKGEFLSQYQLVPVRLEDVILNPEQLKVYEYEPVFSFANNSASAILNGHRLASVGAFWDPSLSKTKGDDSVLAIIFIDIEGNIYVHRTVVVTGGVEEQCKQVADACYDFCVPIVAVETNGIGAYLPPLLMQHTKPKGIGVNAVYTTEKKTTKILEAFETPMSAGRLYVHESVNAGKFPIQMREFDPRFDSKWNAHDDFIDSVASAIKEEPIRIGRGSFANQANRSFYGGGPAHEVQVETFSFS